MDKISIYSIAVLIANVLSIFIALIISLLCGVLPIFIVYLTEIDLYFGLYILTIPLCFFLLWVIFFINMYVIEFLDYKLNR